MKKGLLIALIVILGVAILGGVGYFYVWPMYKNKNIQQDKTAGNEVKPETISDPGVTWIKPEELPDLGLIITGADADFNAAKYYKVATLDSGGQLILVAVSPNFPGGTLIYRFKQDSSGKLFYLANLSDEKDFAKAEKFLASDKMIQLDTQTVYQSITAPNFVKVKNTNFQKSGMAIFEIDVSNLAINEIATTDYGKFYQSIVAGTDGNVKPVTFYLGLADGTYQSYSIKFSFLSDDEVPLITWSDGTKPTAKYTAEGYASCAMTVSMNLVGVTSDLNQRLVEVGKTNAGEKIYTVAATDEVMKAAYDNYKTGRDKNVLTINEFAKNKPIFIWKTGFGGYIVFTSREYAGLAECGKPVIYLYPEKITSVSVKVGATITKSEPTYQNGWQVLAYPSGKLIFNGKTYPYLFWEGKGQEYPQVNSGTIVAKAELRQTIKNQLKELGLNDNEINDFLEFWLPRMPQSPYVRLTWFGTSAMNKLAPLAITPSPDTLIRVFLDFEGLDSQIKITPQKLSAPARQGFTVVEWGGLLRE